MVTKSEARSERITIPVSGMHCAACVSKVEQTLGELLELYELANR